MNVSHSCAHIGSATAILFLCRSETQLFQKKRSNRNGALTPQNAGYFSWLNHEASLCQKQSCVNSPSLSFWSVTTQSLSHLRWHFHNNVCVWLCGLGFVCVNSDRLSHNRTQIWTLKVIVEVLYWLSDNWWVSLSTLIVKKKPAGKREKDPCEYWKMPTRLELHSDCAVR